ncbi:MAG: aspartate kinase [Bacteroidota bacterium]|nr:aspartate kinase [Ignavibacteria bacterium]MCU7497709.1 aspartate kinase [Ignavibacteria bacterium]MCU7510986.1 aspartate kinase [Ignavibacteria bacterium]MCU7518840.1 aspartate kinase [Ignavibacteria bacterium]MCU7523192.1 aspartate kinase [Ignavibacteria bacterium]
MNITVQKYGGSSVASSEKILKIAEKIAQKVSSGSKVILVVSAMGKSTDNLIRLAREVSVTPDPRELDMLLTTGEQVSASLVAMALQSKGLKSKSLNGFQAGIRTTARYNEAKIVSFDKKKILKLMEELDALVVTGFQGITEEGEITTLGRGGSDTSAVALAAALGVDCEIYSDVAGIYTIDPRLHAGARKIKYISYDEMLEMASLGAKVLHSRSVEIAKKFNIKIYCGSTFSDEEGSFVANENIIIEQPVVTGCSLMENQTQVFIKHLPVDYSLVRRIFEKVALEALNVDMISIINSEAHLVVSFTIVESKKKHLQAALSKVLSDLKDWDVEYHTGNIKVSIVGIGMRSGIGVASSFFKALQNVPIKLVTTSEIAISGLIGEEYKQAAVDALVKEFKL